MKFKNEDGLVFNCRPLEKCNFNLVEGNKVYIGTVNLDDELYVVCSDYNPNLLKSKVRRFIGQFKLPIKVISAKMNDDCIEYEDQYSYNYEYLKKWQIKSKRLKMEAEFLSK